MRNAWFGRSLGALALVSVVAAVWLSQWSRRQPQPVPELPADDGAGGRSRRAQVTPLKKGTGAISLAGSVSDFGGGPLADATVLAYPDKPGEPEPAPGSPPPVAVAVARTGADGTFTLEGLEQGVYRISVEGEHLFPTEIRYVDAPARGPVRLIASRRMSIEGVVTDDARPAAGVAVAYSGGGTSGVSTVTAGSDGEFALTDLIEGEYQVWAYRADRAAPAATAARFGAGPFEPVVLAMQPAAIVTGRVVDDATGRGLVADVMLTSETDQPTRYATADETGAFTIEGVLHGTWVPDARADGYVSTETLAFDTARVTSVTLRLLRGGAARGRVVDGAGVPVAGVSVTLSGENLAGTPVVVSAAARRSEQMRYRGEALPLGNGQNQFIPRGELGVMTGPIPFAPPPGARPATPAAPRDDGPDAPRFTTDAQGRYRIEGVPPGRYVAKLSHPSFAPAESRAFSVQLGADTDEIVTVLVPGVVFLGTVTDRVGVAVVGATVSAEQGADNMPVALAVTGTDGRYRLRPVARDVTLRVRAPGYGPVSRDVSVGKPARTLVERTVDFELLSADAELAGRVLDPHGNVLADAIVVAGNRNVSTDAAGRFAIAGLPHGEVELRVSHPGYPTLTVDARTGVPAELALEQGGGISFDVRDAHTTDAIAAGTVIAIGPGKDRRSAPIVDGRADLAPLATGSWQVRAQATGYVAAVSTVGVPAGDGPRAISVRDYRVDLRRGATIAGIVRDSHGERVANAVVTAGDATGKTDADGNFRLTDVVTGDDVVVKASKDGETGETRVSLRPGDEVVTLDVRLE